MILQSWAGKKIGERYEIDTLLGQGGMSAVYRAYDPNLRRKVAIKLIHSHLSTDPKFIDRFKEEAAAVARLRHPNIVQVFDFNFDGQNYYMVLEYLEGDTLQLKLKRLNSEHHFMPLPEALDICIQLCSAVGYAHAHNLIHRDIKPANVMLDLHGQAVLMDFGIVKIVGGDYHTQTGATIGTATYMSPEQIRGERVDHRSDIYSLGVTFYEMLSGRPPFQADSALSLMMSVLNKPLPNLGSIRKDIPEVLRQVVEKALYKDISLRFQTTGEMSAALQHILINLAVKAADTPLGESDQADQSEIFEVSPQMQTEVDDFASMEPEPSTIDQISLTSDGAASLESTFVKVRSSQPMPAHRQIAMLSWYEDGVQKQVAITSAGLTLRRSSMNTLPLNDLALSRFHCKILPDKGGLTLVDLESTNGTFLNNVSVSGSCELRHGDEIRLGKLTFQVEFLSGSDQDAVSAVDKTQPQELGKNRSTGELADIPLLVINSGVGVGKTFMLQKDRLLVGRASHSKQWDVDLVDPFVSRPHAELSHQGGSWVLRDLESDNGTTVNGKPVIDQVVLKDGDVIGLGDTTVVFQAKRLA